MVRKSTEVRWKPGATLGRAQGVALYAGAVLGSGVLVIPAVAAELAGPASLLAWGAMTLLTLPLALTMSLLSARFPGGGGVSTFVREAFGPAASAVVGWAFLLAVPLGAPLAGAYAGWAALYPAVAGSAGLLAWRLGRIRRFTGDTLPTSSTNQRRRSCPG